MSGGSGSESDPRPDPDDEAEVDETMAGGLHYPDEEGGPPKRVGPEDEAREDLKGEASAAQAVKDAFPKP
jgi:hypothetical protein